MPMRTTVGLNGCLRILALTAATIIGFSHGPSSTGNAYTTLGALKGPNLVRKGIIFNPEIRVKISGRPHKYSLSDTPQLVTHNWTDLSETQIAQFAITTAFEFWLNPLRSISPKPLATKIKFVDEDEDIEFGFLEEIGSSFYNPLTRTINLKRNHHQFSKVLHELGHAFGLGDSGLGISLGGESKNSADSVMKIPNALTQLELDDIQGVRHHFCLDTNLCDSNKYPSYTVNEAESARFIVIPA
jgi:hypothetical protein